MVCFTSISKYKALILDLDGTLYFQNALRTKMALALTKYYFLHPNKLKDLKIISTFRKLREHNLLDEANLEEIQFREVAIKLSVHADYTKALVEKWMYVVPLQYLPACCDVALKKQIQSCRERGMIIAVYSDYPAVEKLKALGIKADFCFCSTDPEISCLKPNPKAMRVILDKIGFTANECLFIGDRYEKDGLSAQSVGMDYLILPPKKAQRK